MADPRRAMVDPKRAMATSTDTRVDTRRSLPPVMYRGLIYFTAISDVYPQGIIQVSEEEMMMSEMWLLLRVINLFSDMNGFLSKGLLVVLTTSKVVNLEDFSASYPGGFDKNMLMFDREYFRPLFRTNRSYFSLAYSCFQ